MLIIPCAIIKMSYINKILVIINVKYNKKFELFYDYIKHIFRILFQYASI